VELAVQALAGAEVTGALRLRRGGDVGLELLEVLLGVSSFSVQ